mmetsp:Transcript_40217/g.29661  ORF Transcript_40217/g.29661 Transcript_40217/m.29661 type:complete len:160 (+) Transcript_40217:75-554(+)|eukprot:CAMPEP_0202955780 /NCGR_PEP_ID=MMETSP1396-20130829/301_1 /ASSEMBLY_ACC=CAM_ASM_000872 /TAXON_ID= /ORGANISM="Pseudokeronopsis sp., Strain Brazil" /LENGTH=159 /DNA_ID=CAMNT_0049672477 /DNA_START=62 /DNA_END=541 /DNA_ORIENTATION=-
MDADQTQWLDTTCYFWGYMGIAAALVFANLGAAYGTARSGLGIAALGILKPELIFKSIVPIIMAGILGIYGLIVAVILQGNVGATTSYNDKAGYQFFSSGLCCGLSSLAAGLAIGVVGDAGVRANAQQEAIFVGMILILIFAEAIGLYGLIIAIILTQT